MQKEKEYILQWKISVCATDPKSAAELVNSHFIGRAAEIGAFIVEDVKTKEKTFIDLVMDMNEPVIEKLPEVILECEGGLIQNITASIPVKVYNLDSDIFENQVIDESEYFEDSLMHVDIIEGDLYQDKRAEIKATWDKNVNNALLEQREISEK